MKLLFPEFKKNIEDHELVRAGDTVILGFSGGKDSVTLALLLQELQKHIPFRLVAAYFNHRLRADAREEENWVRAFCAARGIELETGSRDLKRFRAENRLNLEHAASLSRYDFFTALARRHPRRPRRHRPQPLRPGRDLLHQAFPRQRPAGALGHFPEQGEEDHPPAADLFRGARSSPSWSATASTITRTRPTCRTISCATASATSCMPAVQEDRARRRGEDLQDRAAHPGRVRLFPGARRGRSWKRTCSWERSCPAAPSPGCTRRRRATWPASTCAG